MTFSTLTRALRGMFRARLGWMALALGSFIYGWRRDRVIAFALLWIALTLGPISNILVATGVLIAERTLFLPSVGIALIAGRLIAMIWPQVAMAPALIIGL